MLFLYTGHTGLLARRFNLFALAKVGGKGHDFALISGLQPLENDAGIKPARISENDAVDLVCHGNPE